MAEMTNEQLRCEIARVIGERDVALSRVTEVENALVDAIQGLNGVARLKGVNLERRLRDVQDQLYGVLNPRREGAGDEQGD